MRLFNEEHALNFSLHAEMHTIYTFVDVALLYSTHPENKADIADWIFFELNLIKLLTNLKAMLIARRGMSRFSEEGEEVTVINFLGEDEARYPEYKEKIAELLSFNRFKILVKAIVAIGRIEPYFDLDLRAVLPQHQQAKIAASLFGEDLKITLRLLTSTSLRELVLFKKFFSEIENMHEDLLIYILEQGLAKFIKNPAEALNEFEFLCILYPEYRTLLATKYFLRDPYYFNIWITNYTQFMRLIRWVAYDTPESAAPLAALALRHDHLERLKLNPEQMAELAEIISPSPFTINTLAELESLICKYPWHKTAIAEIVFKDDCLSRLISSREPRLSLGSAIGRISSFFASPKYDAKRYSLTMNAWFKQACLHHPVPGVCRLILSHTKKPNPLLSKFPGSLLMGTSGRRSEAHGADLEALDKAWLDSLDIKGQKRKTLSFFEESDDKGSLRPAL